MAKYPRQWHFLISTNGREGLWYGSLTEAVNQAIAAGYRGITRLPILSPNQWPEDWLAEEQAKGNPEYADPF